MTYLEDRIAELHDQIIATPDDQREELLDHLEQAVLTLENQGVPAPHWARVHLMVRVDAEVEDQFDNMPI